ncbi:hypothetical protein Cylst_3539 [Cylindrospermum stagnale PCC 7417]|uniref:Uncharacterized protein n=1 Tax=Cylindrospermum stagnale PCC 7417 TaxID=56107 RepID=K9X1R3_9NOST|nr:hypothetical protein [Cylindrospermum stagnale]AFZ25677.1 hypothetical protein Cylst_3539 [Cylindrospermum stagnale PCC 7417]
MTLAYILTESDKDIRILKRLLPPQLIQNVTFIAGASPYRTRSLASSLLGTRSIPVALVIDANTEDKDQIFEKSDLIEYVFRQASAGIPFQVGLATPEIEVILLQNKSLIEKIANRSFTDLEWQFAQSHPKRFLAEVFGKDTPVIDTILSNISDDDIKILQQHPLIQDLINFLSSIAVAPTV